MTNDRLVSLQIQARLDATISLGSPNTARAQERKDALARCGVLRRAALARAERSHCYTNLCRRTWDVWCDERQDALDATASGLNVSGAAGRKRAKERK